MSDTLDILRSNLKPGQEGVLPPALDQAPSLPPAAGVVQQLPGIGQIAQKAAQSPNYQALKKPASFGAAGLAPLAGAVIPATIAAAPFAAAAAVPAGIAYGIGKLVAPKWTDEAVGKIKDFITQRVAPLVGKAEEVGSAFMTGEAKALPGSRFLQSKLPEATQEYINQIVQQHPQAAMAGQIGGTVGMMALPGLNLIKGAGILPAAGNAALNMAPFALGTGLDVGATTGDVGKGVKAGLLSEAGGTVLGGALGGLAKIPAVNRLLAKLQMKGAGMSTADVTKVLRARAKSLGMQGGAVDTFVTKNMDNMLDQSANLISQFGSGKAGKAAMKETLGNAWDAHGTLLDGLTGKKVTGGDIAAVAGDADLSEVRAIFGDDAVNAAVQKIGGKIDGQGWSRARNNILPKYIDSGTFGAQKRFGMSAEDPRILESEVGQAWRDHLDANADHVMEWAKGGQLGADAAELARGVPELHVLKAVYPAQKAIGKTAARESGWMSKIAEEASPTFARQAMSTILQGGASAGGAMVGGPIGAIAANIGGRALGSIGGRLAEKGAGALAGVLRGAEGMSTLAPEVVASEVPRFLNAPATAPTPASTLFPAASVPETPVPAMPSGAQPIPNAPAEQEAPHAASLTAPLSPKEQAQADFSAPAEPKPGSNTFSDKAINARLEEKYSRYVRQYGQAITFDQYKQAAFSATNGFDPMQPSTWKAMFDDPATSDKLYKGYMGLQQMAGVNVEDVLNHYSRLLHLGPRIATADQRREDEANSRVVGALASMTGRPTKEIDQRLQLLALDRSKTPAQRKQALMEIIIKEGGVDVPLLANMGLLGG